MDFWIVSGQINGGTVFTERRNHQVILFSLTEIHFPQAVDPAYAVAAIADKAAFLRHVFNTHPSCSFVLIVFYQKKEEKSK